MPPSKSDPLYIEEGVAIDQEKIIALRPQIEEAVLEMLDLEEGTVKTKLEWNMIRKGRDTGKFWYKIEFYEKD